MNNMELVGAELFERCLNQYGIQAGDNSLRYIGITISEEKVIPKIYRTPSNRDVNLLPVNIKNIWQAYFQNMARCLPLTLCDYSFSKFNEIDSMRLEVLLDTSLEEKYIDYLCKNSSWLTSEWKRMFLQNYHGFNKEFNPNSSIFRIIGIESDDLGNLLNLKYYLYFDKKSTISFFQRNR